METINEVNDPQSSAANGADSAKTQSVNPPSNPAHATLPSDHPLVRALEAQKQRNAQQLAEMQQMKAQLNLVTANLGEIDPNRLNQIQEAIQAQSQMEQRLEQVRQEAARQVEERYSQNVNQLTASLNSSQTQLQQIQQSNALQGLFAQCGGNDYASFKALMDSRYKIEFGDTTDPFSPPPIKGIYNRADNTPVSAEDGRALKPEEVLILLRQGKLGGNFGEIVKNTFTPYNQSTGNGYAPSAGSPSLGEVNPFNAKKVNMTQVGNLYKNDPALALRLAKESGNPQVAGLIKAWSGQ